MKVLVVLAHPNPLSLCSRIAKVVQGALQDAGHSVDLLSLHKEQFDPVLPLSELYTIGNTDRSPQVLDFQSRVARAEALIFISPTWWFDLPAILKGFIDRVFTPGFAFSFSKRGIPKGLLQGKRAILIQTFASPRFVATWLFPNAGWRNFKKSILRFCGLRRIKWLPVFSTNKINAANFESKLQRVLQIAKLLA